jgi:hypothetical protein
VFSWFVPKLAQVSERNFNMFQGKKKQSCLKYRVVEKSLYPYLTYHVARLTVQPNVLCDVPRHLWLNGGEHLFHSLAQRITVAMALHSHLPTKSYPEW